MPRPVLENSGMMPVAALFLSAFIVFAFFFVDLDGNVAERAVADDLSTSVTVLNTPPQWSVDAEEQVGSSSSTPTNTDSTLTWVGTGDDPSGDNYFLLICKDATAPTANADGPPICGGGDSNEWAVSGTTTDLVEASAATTTYETLPEGNLWYAWICDANASLPKCNTTFKEGSGTTSSPFVINHRPTFDAFIDDSPVVPGGTVTWYSTSTDTDVEGAADTVKLFVCKAADFDAAAGECGAGGTWASSTLAASDPATSTVIAIPTADTDYGAFGYIVDNHGHTATTTQGTDSVLTVSNVAPTISAASVSLLDTDEAGSLTLTVASGETTSFKAKFTVDDDNSCETSGATDEFTYAFSNVYRSGVTSAGCDAGAEYDANNCYPADIGGATWNITCSQDAGSCSGTTDSDATWTCTFPLWHIAQPTDGANLTDSTWFAEDWLASARVNDDDLASSTLTEASSGNELISFLAFDVATTSIDYGALEPGQSVDPIDRTTDLAATGNVGLDEDLYGDTMCTTWSGADSCDPVDTSEDISVDNQKFATSSVAYSSATTLTSSTTPTELEINVPKSTTTATAATLDTYWGIQIPSTITTAGDYSGQNTITAIKGEAEDW